MKRSRELSPLSHDHHQALFAAQRLRRADDPEEGAAQLLDYWEAHGNRHFEIEEGLLLPAWFEHDPNADPAIAARVAADHLAIRTSVRRAGAGLLDLDGLRETGALIAEHVRFEERRLFPLIESGLEAGALAVLGGEIAIAEGP